jgi:ABC-type siderophore export system fused ATPase/permease subunit
MVLYMCVHLWFTTVAPYCGMRSLHQCSTYSTVFNIRCSHCTTRACVSTVPVVCGYWYIIKDQFDVTLVLSTMVVVMLTYYCSTVVVLHCTILFGGEVINFEHTHARTHTCTHMRARAHTHTHTHTHTCKLTHTNRDRNTRMHAHTYKHTHKQRQTHRRNAFISIDCTKTCWSTQFKMFMWHGGSYDCHDVYKRLI